ncbi:MAG TPA: hypothetical protein VFA48_11490 [Gammaproteobacteria bacterium]|nr:hypothetical protein [Gammaproteobacteria bacterium]
MTDFTTVNHFHLFCGLGGGAIGLTWFGKIDGTAFGYSLLIILGAHKGAKVLGGLKSTKTVTKTTEAQP